MKILMINSVCGIRSTGRICTDLAVELEKLGHTVKIAYGREAVPEQFKKYAVRVGNELDVRLHAIKARLFDCSGFCSKSVTRKFIQWIKEYDPDVIHLHNLHGYYINVELLFKYLKNSNKKIIWTLHDCWAFTGHCAYFDYIGCIKWIKECHSCQQKKEYPSCIGVDKSRRNYLKKRQLFTDIYNLRIVVPSQWLSDLIKKSFLKNYQTDIIYNGVDVNTFKPTKSNLREKYNIGNKKVILGVAAVWDRRKGFNEFVKLSRILSDEYIIILVGLKDEQIKLLPANIIGISKTDSTIELAALYTLADIFLNLTFEDNYPTTNIESIACGTPTITYCTGGSIESAKIYGCVVDKGDIEAVKNIITYYCNNTDVLRYNDDIIKYIDKRETLKKYIELYSNN